MNQDSFASGFLAGVLFLTFCFLQRAKPPVIETKDNIVHLRFRR